MNSICTEVTSEKTLESVGKILSQARQEHKIRDLNVIAEDLCIKSYLLEALEQGKFESFPSSCYAIGFLKNYAAYLDLDIKDVVSRYEEEYEGSKECVVLTFPEAEKHNSLPIKSIAGIATLCVILCLGVWANMGRFDQAVTPQEPAPKNLHTTKAHVEAKVVPEITTMISDDVRLKANQDVWVRLSEQDGTVLVEKILSKGEDLIAPESDGVSLMTNNAAGLSVYVDGKAVNALGAEGEIIENIALEQEKLLTLSMLQ